MIPKNSRHLFVFAVVAIAVANVGCAKSIKVPSISHSPIEYANGLTLVLPGVEGIGPFSASVVKGLRDGNTKVEIHDWTTGQPLRSLEHLVHLDRNLLEANRLLDKIVNYRNRFPNAPINLIGHSGGAAIIALALSELPLPVQVDQVVFLSPALARDFDLSRAMNQANLIYNFHSPFDVQLTVGTAILGTVDRGFGKAAGASGFVKDSDTDNLIQIPYHPTMFLDGNHGGHMGTTSSRFIRKHVAPLLSQ